MTRKTNRRIGYLMSRFPKLTETFVLYEILAMEQLGVSVEIYPLHRERCDVVHPEAQALVDRANFTQLLSLSVLAANLYWLFRRPGAYLGAWACCLWATLGSRRYFIGSLAAVPLAARIARLMQRDNIEHVHAHFASHPAAAGLVIQRLTGIPFSFTAHGSDLHRERRMLREKMDECKFAVAISDYNRTWIARECGEQYKEKTHVVRCGIDPECFDFAAKDATHVSGTLGKLNVSTSSASDTSSNSPFQILCIGSLHEVKGQSFLIQAAGILRRQGVNLQVHFVGDGEDRAMLEALASSEQVADITIFHGQQSRPQVLRHLSEADVAVAPSVLSSDGRREGIPVVLMEAMAARLPVVASRISGIPELVIDGVTGLLTSPANPEELAQALHQLSDNVDLRRQLGAAGRERVEQHFHLHHEARRLALLFGCELSASPKSSDLLAEASA